MPGNDFGTHVYYNAFSNSSYWEGKSAMNSMAEVQYVVQFETEIRSPYLQARRERYRQAWWFAAASASRGAKREWPIRRAAVWLGDIVAGLRCQLESRFASEPAATAC